jgi:hypothetical protein
MELRRWNSAANFGDACRANHKNDFKNFKNEGCSIVGWFSLI